MRNGSLFVLDFIQSELLNSKVRLLSELPAWKQHEAEILLLVDADHCVRSVHVQSYSGPHFPAFGLNTMANNAMKLL